MSRSDGQVGPLAMGAKSALDPSASVTSWHWEKPPREGAATLVSGGSSCCLLACGGEQERWRRGAGDGSTSALGTPLQPPQLLRCLRSGRQGVRGEHAERHCGCLTPFGLLLVCFSGPHLAHTRANKQRWVKKSLR